MSNWQNGDKAVETLASLTEGDTFAVRYELSYDGPVVKYCHVTSGPHTDGRPKNEYVLLNCVLKASPSREAGIHVSIRHRQSSAELRLRETESVEYELLGVCLEPQAISSYEV